MKIKRFVAKDMRSALLQIKEELGMDAVIMSNKKIPEGIELMAAIDYSQAQSQETNGIASSETGSSAQTSDATSARAQHQEKVEPVLNQQRADAIAQRAMSDDKVTLGSNSASVMNSQHHLDGTPPADSLQALLNRQVKASNISEHDVNNSVANKPAVNQSQASDIEQQFKSFTDRLQNTATQFESTQGHEQTSNNAHAVAVNEREYSSKAENSSHLSDSVEQRDNAHLESQDIVRMQKEMASIRQLLEHQVSGLMWQDMAQKDPQRALLVNRLMALGLNEQIADQIAGYVPKHCNEQEAWQHALALMSDQLNTTNNDIIHRGGVVALVGPTGVGKTTTIAKLAARFAQIHGADQVAVISTDNYRIAGFEQLQTYARIIGCQVKQAQDANALDLLLQQMSNKKLVLIDTAGMGQRDMRLAEHLTALISNVRVKVRNYLVLAANTQQRVMQENVERFKKVPLAGCIYTKVDESVSVGEIISTSIQNGLAIGYLTDGQRVPEDIKVANAEKLVTLADKMSAKLTVSSSNHYQAMSVA